MTTSVPAPPTGGFDRLVYRSAAFQSAFRAVCRVQQRWFERRARDVSTEVVSRRCLVLAPHPDDETLGVGATILRKRAAGTPVRVVIAADGRHANPSGVIDEFELARIRQTEGFAACAALGVEAADVRFGGFEDTTLDRHVDELVRLIVEELASYRPDEVLVPLAIDRHPDHRALHLALTRALDQFDGSPVVLEYPIWFWDAKAWLDPEASLPRKLGQLAVRPVVALFRLRPCSVDATSVLASKRAAMDAYRSQMENLTGEPDWPVMDPEFLGHFFRPRELLFASTVGVRGRR